MKDMAKDVRQRTIGCGRQGAASRDGKHGIVVDGMKRTGKARDGKQGTEGGGSEGTTEGGRQGTAGGRGSKRLET